MHLEDLAHSPHFRSRLPLLVAARLTAAELEAARAHGWLLPMAGGDGEGDDGAGDGAPSSGGSGGAGGASGDDDADDDGDDGASDDDGDDGNDDGAAAADRAELNRVKRAAAEADKRARKAERALSKRQEADRKEQGQYEALYNEEQKKTSDLATRISNGARDRSIVAIAQRLDFHNPNAAVKLIRDELPDDVVDMPDDLTEEPSVDDAAIEKELKRAVKNDPWLVKDQRNQDADAGRGERRGRTGHENANGNEEAGAGTSGPGLGTLRDAFAEAERTGGRGRR